MSYKRLIHSHTENFAARKQKRVMITIVHGNNTHKATVLTLYKHKQCQKLELENLFRFLKRIRWTQHKSVPTNAFEHATLPSTCHYFQFLASDTQCLHRHIMALVLKYRLIHSIKDTSCGVQASCLTTKLHAHFTINDCTHIIICYIYMTYNS